MIAEFYMRSRWARPSLSGAMSVCPLVLHAACARKAKNNWERREREPPAAITWEIFFTLALEGQLGRLFPLPHGYTFQGFISPVRSLESFGSFAFWLAIPFFRLESISFDETLNTFVRVGQRLVELLKLSRELFLIWNWLCWRIQIVWVWGFSSNEPKFFHSPRLDSAEWSIDSSKYSKNFLGTLKQLSRSFQISSSSASPRVSHFSSFTRLKLSLATQWIKRTHAFSSFPPGFVSRLLLKGPQQPKSCRMWDKFYDRINLRQQRQPSAAIQSTCAAVEGADWRGRGCGTMLMTSLSTIFMPHCKIPK